MDCESAKTLTCPAVSVETAAPDARARAARVEDVLWIHTAASPSMGFGHLRRSLVLARLIRAGGMRVVFVFGANDIWSGTQVDDGGYQRVRMSPGACWPAEDDPAALLIDIRGSDAARALCLEARRRGIPVLSIHDLGLEQLPSDVVIDGSVAPGTHGFGEHPAAYAGPSYLVLDPEFGSLRARPREIRRSIGSVVVALGGGDSSRYFSKILEGLRLWNRPVEVTGFSGFSRWGQEQIDSAGWAPMKFRWAAAGESVAEAMFGADLVFTAGGLTIYESLSAGAPTLGLACDEYQHVTVSTLARLGACLDLGMGAQLTAAALPDVLERLARDGGRRMKLSERGRELVDGAGAARVGELVRAAAARRTARVCR